MYVDPATTNWGRGAAYTEQRTDGVVFGGAPSARETVHNNTLEMAARGRFALKEASHILKRNDGTSQTDIGGESE